MSTKTSSRTLFGPTTTAGGVTAARQSTRVAVHEHSDGAVWQEKLVVCEGTNDSGLEPLILIRSYYRNLETMEKVWDEPPSGAAAIVYATPDERNKAEEQRMQLELTLQMIPEDVVTIPTHPNDHHHPVTAPEQLMVMDPTTATNNNHKKKRFFGRFRKASSTAKRDHVDTAKDINLQKAIARSIQEQVGGIDDVELAMALSLSVADRHSNNYNSDDDDKTDAAIAFYPPHRNEPTEEELFQRALERSQREKSQKRPPKNHDDDDDDDEHLRVALERSQREKSPKNYDDDDDEHLRVALQRSQREKSAKPRTPNDDDEDEYLRVALERSKEDLFVRAPPVASLPKNYDDYLGDDSSSSALGNPKENLSEDELELKMPAKPKPKFDPFGKW